MKNNIVSTLPVIALVACGATFAQSSVTIFGNLDEAVTVVKGQNTWSGLNSGGSSNTYFGLRGTEDLGSGLKAQFWLESGINVDTGSGNSKDGGIDFKRRATVGVIGGLGEVHLGRSETAAYKTIKRYDVFNYAGIASSQAWSIGKNNDKRKDNLVSYISPSFGGLTFAADYAFGEQTHSTWKTKAYYDAVISYAHGPLSAAIAAEQQNNQNITDFDFRQRAYSVGGSYDFSSFKLFGAYRQINNAPKAGGSYKDRIYTLGASAHVGQVGLVKASYNRYEHEALGATNKTTADHLSLGYIHNLSKRTSLFSIYSFLKNKKGGTLRLVSDSSATLSDSGKQQGVQIGVRHSF